MTISKRRSLAYAMTSLVLVVMLFMIALQPLQARQFRMINSIATPTSSEPLPEGAVAIKQFKQLPRDMVEPLVLEVMEKWNSPGMSETLSDQFYDKSRLLDVMDTGVPRDAKLRVQSIQGIQTLNQYITTNESSGRQEMISIVSATVRTQLEYNNASGGFEAETGTNELILKVTSTTK
ncbi:MAG: hypothetical protein RIB78_04100 [Gammaproteobacteria bacterium]